MGDRNQATTPRRGFFREAVTRLVGPLSDYMDKRLGPGVHHGHLRPPGAMEEARFLDACERCGRCVDACPADAIFLLDRTHASATGTPVIDPDRAACVVCDGLQCTQVCPSGGLAKLTDPSMIRMGLARAYEPLCERTRGQHCTSCVDRCPLGDAAIRIVGSGPPEVRSPGCVGCGVCQFCCPTSPKAITVMPR